jgi:hypothetical protein
MRRVSGRKEVKADVRSPGAAPQNWRERSFAADSACSTLITSSPGNGTTLFSALFAYKRRRLGLASNSEPSQIWSRT